MWFLDGQSMIQIIFQLYYSKNYCLWTCTCPDLCLFLRQEFENGIHVLLPELPFWTCGLPPEAESVTNICMHIPMHIRLYTYIYIYTILLWKRQVEYHRYTPHQNSTWYIIYEPCPIGVYWPSRYIPINLRTPAGGISLIYTDWTWFIYYISCWILMRCISVIFHLLVFGGLWEYTPQACGPRGIFP